MRGSLSMLGSRSLWAVAVVSVVLLLLLAFATSASALVPTVSGYTYGSGRPTYSTQQAACDAFAVESRVTYSQPTLVGQLWNGNFSCRAVHPASGNTFANVNLSAVTGACPANSSPVSGGCQCNSGYVEQGGQCSDPNAVCAAKTGQADIINWTAGWQRTPSIGDNSPFIAPNNPGSTGSVCDGGCTKQFETFAPCPECRSYVSQVPNAQGLYRVSIEFRARYTGVACTSSQADNPARPDESKDPQCPGYVGEVNGVKGCFGTADKPVRPQSNFIPPGSPQQAGNPPAGAAPAGQPGQTPSGGSGGSAGGPSGAAAGPSGSGGSGTVSGSGNGSGRVAKQDGTEQQECGAPGQPVCAVKVDETGVPAAVATTFDTANSKMDETKGKAEEQLGKASGTADKGFLETARGLFWAPPFAACEVIQLPPQIRSVASSVSIDPCGVVDGGRAIMGFVWAATGLFMCLGMIKRSI